MDDFNESLCSLYSHSNDDLNQTFQFHSSFDENMVTTEKTISDSPHNVFHQTYTGTSAKHQH